MKKSALITGSTRGIGKQIGLMLLKKGYYVFFNYCQNDDKAAALKEELKEYEGKFDIIKAELSNLTSVESLIKNVLEKVKKIDVLVLNAGVTCKVPYNEITEKQWNYVMDTNVNMPFFMVQKLDKYLNNNGRIIFIASVLGVVPHAISIPYSVSKAAQIMLAKSLVKEYKTRNITVNVIAPGFVDTDWQGDKTPEHRKRVEEKIAVGRFAKPCEIALSCEHIIDNEYINGAVIQIDGGYDM